MHNWGNWLTDCQKELPAKSNTGRPNDQPVLLLNMYSHARLFDIHGKCAIIILYRTGFSTKLSAQLC